MQKQTQFKPKQSQFQRQKNVFGCLKILTINNMDANFEKLYGVLAVYRKDSFWEVIKCRLIQNFSF
jgi:hypothetical protein